MFIYTMDSSSIETNYSKETLREAVRSILNGNLTVSEVVEKYHGSIPRRTIQHHVKYDIIICTCIYTVMHPNYYHEQQQLRKGNVFTSVCQDFCPYGRSKNSLPCINPPSGQKPNRNSWPFAETPLPIGQPLLWPLLELRHKLPSLVMSTV